MRRCSTKRLLDIVASAVALVVLSPILIVIAVLLRFTGEGDVIYVQRRVGREGKIFRIYKFVTMRRDSERMLGGLITTCGDPRVFPVGRVLRKTKINELPQFANVFLGQMSIVGPRPQVPRHYEVYSKQVQTRLAEMKPGITGIGSLVFRDEEDILTGAGAMRERVYAQVIAPFKGELEVWYSRRRCFRVDVALCAATAVFLVYPRVSMLWRLFPDLPRPGREVAQHLGVEELSVGSFRGDPVKVERS